MGPSRRRAARGRGSGNCRLNRFLYNRLQVMLSLSRDLCGSPATNLGLVWSGRLWRRRAGRRGVGRLTLEGQNDRVAQSVEQRTLSGSKEPHAGRSGTALSECRSMLGRPESCLHHNVAGNGERDGLKSKRIGQSAGKRPATGRPQPQRLDAARLRWRRYSPDFQLGAESGPRLTAVRSTSRWSVKADEVR